MTTSTQSTAPTRNRSRLWSAAQIVIFDIAGPLVAYQMLRSAGLSTVSALVLSGVLPGVAVLGLAAQAAAAQAAASEPALLAAR
jgi:hypothetical protein